MPKQQNVSLILLIKSMSASEKRSFKLFAKRSSRHTEMLYLKLFDVLDKASAYDEKVILKKIPELKKSQLSNLKANLFKQILTSLRLIYRNTLPDINIREQFDFARVLYSKGLYTACLDALDKAKKAAKQTTWDTLQLEIIDFEKLVESQHVTGNMSRKASVLSQESDSLLEKMKVKRKLTNITILLYGLFLERGYVKTKEDYVEVDRFFKKLLPEVNEQQLTELQKLDLYQSLVWYHNLTQNFPNSFKYAQKWVGIFDTNPNLLTRYELVYLKGLHHLLTACFMLQRYDRFEFNYMKLESFEKDFSRTLSNNMRGQWESYRVLHGINRYFMNAQYEQAARYADGLALMLKKNPHGWDVHKMLTLNYKMACIYFGNNELDTAIDYLNKVMLKVYPNFAEDIQCFARILSIIIHFDLGNEWLVTSQIRSTFRFLLRMSDLQAVQLEIIKFLRRTPKMHRDKMPREFLDLKVKLEALRNQDFQRRPFLYLDIISWLDAKLEGRLIKEVIQEKLRD